MSFDGIILPGDKLFYFVFIEGDDFYHLSNSTRVFWLGPPSVHSNPCPFTGDLKANIKLALPKPDIRAVS